MFRLILVLFLISVVAADSPLGEGPAIPRFARIGEGLYRGGQPTERGFQLLKERGIKTVINLREENNSEETVVRKLGMNYVRIPVHGVRPWTRIPESAISEYFELLNHPENYPIFFHCRRGADRTGLFAALYRMTHDHWDATRAYDEARSFGMRWYYVGLKCRLMNFVRWNEIRVRRIKLINSA